MKYRVLLLAAMLLVFGLRSAEAAVDLDYLIATVSEGAVEIEWRTGSEQDTAGFSLKRSTTPPDNAFISDTTGPFIDVVEEGSSSPTDFINARGSTVAGDTYTVIDENVVPGETYYYLLVETVISGGRTPYGDDIADVTVGDDDNGGQLPTSTPVTPTTQSSTPTAQPTDTQEPTSTTAAGQPTSTPRPTNTPPAANTTAATSTPDSDDDDDDDNTPTPAATDERVFITPTAQQQTNTPVPTDTQSPTDTPAPTDTAEPTSTTGAGQPTSTPRPTNTPPPTTTPRPTNTPIPVSDSDETGAGGGNNVVATPEPLATATAEQVAVVPDDSGNPPVAEAQDDDAYPVDQTDDGVATDDPATSDPTEEGYVEPVATVGEFGGAEEIGSGGDGSADSIGNQPVPLTTPLPTTAQEAGGVNPLLWLVFGAGVLVFGAGVVGSILIFTRKQDNV